MGEFRSEGRGDSDRGSDRGFGRPRRDFGGRSEGRGFGGGRGRSFGGGGGRGYGGGRDGGRGERRPLEFHKVICAKCNKETEVPFKPSGNKPVLCRECFNGGDGSRAPRREFSRGPSRERSFAPRSENTQSSSGSADLAQINAKLDRIIKVLQELEIDSDEEESEEDTPERGVDEEVEVDENGESEDEPKDK